MDILILIIAACAFLHFIYEGIVAPSIRTKLRNDMFELRDELRNLHISKDDRCSREAFEIAHTGVNQYLDRLHAVTISFMRRFREAYKDADFRADVERRQMVLNSCESTELRKIVASANSRIELALFANSAGWLIYLVPVALLGICIKAITRWVHRRISQLFATPEAGTFRLMPDVITA